MASATQIGTLRLELPIAPFREYERTAGLMRGFMNRQNPRDEELVVTPIVARVLLAFQGHQHAGKERSVELAIDRADTIPLAAPGAGKLI